MMRRLFQHFLSVVLGLVLVLSLGAWKSLAGPGGFEPASREYPGWSGGGGKLGPTGSEKAGQTPEAIGPLCQMGGMMGRGECGMGYGRSPRPGTPAAGEGGAGIFSRNCAVCHPGGGNNLVPSLPIRGSARLGNFNTFRAYVRYPKMPDGTPGAMPAFPPSRISDAQLRQLYQYLRSRWGG
jgi:mono/diheme cytochrome c family protein